MKSKNSRGEQQPPHSKPQILQNVLRRKRSDVTFGANWEASFAFKIHAPQVWKNRKIGERKKKELKKTRAGRFRKAKKEDRGVLDRNADDESWTRIRKNALWTVPRQAVERTT
ncbi:hypothetical protein TNCV_937421 [Trichonephila clavipes]|nr:hypothetical protein TNCV_937421 [Trichonephila clavipes]